MLETMARFRRELMARRQGGSSPNAVVCVMTCIAKHAHLRVEGECLAAAAETDREAAPCVTAD